MILAARPALLATMLACAGLATIPPAQAAELLSAPLYSISATFTSSSNSSDIMGEGDYRIVQLAPAEDRQGYTHLTLQAVQHPDLAAVELFVPTPDVEKAGLQAEQIITASKRDYGMALATADTGTFTIVLSASWQKDLAANKVL